MRYDDFLERKRNAPQDEYFDIGARYCQDKEDELDVPTLFDLKGI
ncbi:hypothetical protein LCGC14_2770580 [marine sediment metagenome]|uniref:Uncharacterized protein n=1 Tax=marine sediment metagenome TaxID=412755 RepID=A0A0F8ZI29_9ZZZZ